MATNYDLVNVQEVINAGIKNFSSKNGEMMKKLADDQAEMLTKIGKMQSFNIKAGLMPDDGDDIVKMCAEIQEEVEVNLQELVGTIESFNCAMNAALDGAGFMRVNRTEEEKKPEEA